MNKQLSVFMTTFRKKIHCFFNHEPLNLCKFSNHACLLSYIWSPTDNLKHVYKDI